MAGYVIRCFLSSVFALTAVTSLFAQQNPEPSTITIKRVQGSMAIDGDLSDAGWGEVTPWETWYETNPGDNIPPKVQNRGYLAYDDRFFYAAFDFFDNDMSKLRAPFGDRDNVPSTTDYGGIIVNTSNDRKTAILFLANARGIQYDAITSDASGEDSSPDWYWDTAAKIHADRWTLEMRIPFSSLRYSKADPQTWGIMMYRNHPRDRRQQYFSTRLPRGGSCFICHSNTLVGLQGLPSAGHLIAAPYITSKQESFPESGLGSPLRNEDAEFDGGLDAKWTPNEDTAVDITVNPDFSQVESDVAQITANERFAIFFPEKRPFFLEGIDLFSTPFRAVYTRSITSPKWGLRSTGSLGETAYTVLVADDRGGGTAIIPGPNFSRFADQNFESTNLIGRLRRDYGQSFGSLLVAAREIDGGGHNRLLGPDFQWRPNERHTLTGQLLYSTSDTPLELGQKLSGHAGQLWYFYSTPKVDYYAEVHDVGDEFRADLGFIPQVGYRRGYGEGGYTWRPTDRFFHRIRLFSWGDYQAEQDGALIFRQMVVGTGLDGRWQSFSRFFVALDKVRSGNVTLDRERVHYSVEATPSLFFNRVGISGWIGEDIDFANSQVGDGANINLFASIRPTDHLELRFDNNVRYLDVDTGRLFTAQVERLRATYTFSARSFLRVIGQHVRTDAGVTSGSLTASALYAYKLNWQTVLFLGVGDNRAFTDDATLEPSDRQLFLKVSYAVQR